MILPPEEPKNPELMGMYIMESLGAGQICPFIEMVHQAGGFIHCVYSQNHLGILGRYAIIYRCDEELGMEVRT
jgi:hypothetical protein